MLRILPACLLFAAFLVGAPASAAKVGAGDTQSPAAVTPNSANSATILVFGDSLSAGYGIAQDQAWPSLMARRLQSERRSYTVSNASISGETTAGGRSRLPEALERLKPSVVIIALGANDGLRGLPVGMLRDNLVTMVRAAKAKKARVLLVGMQLPPNYGKEYTQAFTRAFATVAKQEKIALLPFLLAPIAADNANFQPDGLHPVASAQAKILSHVWPALKPLLK